MNIITGGDVKDACGSDQLCSGLKAGGEAAIHAMNNLYQDHADDCWGFLFNDAINAFNTMSRPVALWNSRILWSRCSRYLFNSYRGYPVLILKGTDKRVFSKEGFTQGDSLAMQGYAVGQLPLIKKL